MSGGRLVVLDRSGREVKRFPLAEGLATLGSDPACDIRIMLPTVSAHHASVVVHANQTVVRNVCEGETLVNGRCVSVAALRHGDVIAIGGRQLRWDYADPAARRAQAPQPALYVSRRKGRTARRGSGPAAAAARDPALRLALELTHRASMPGSAGGKQVAIVQPQRRDTSDQIDKNLPRAPTPAKRPRTSKSDLDTSINETENEKAKRKSNFRVSPKTTLPNLQNTTKATLWIESRKTSPRKSTKIQTPTQEQVLRARRNTASAKKSTPLRLAVLKKAQSAQKMKVTKIEAPLKIDHTKQAAILLMTGHTKSKLSSANSSSSFVRSPSLVVKKASPASRASRACRASRASRAATSATDRTVTVLEITDSDGRNSSVRRGTATRRSGQKSSKESPAVRSPRKSALKDPSAKRGMRKTESIKFDLSNLENRSQDTDVLMVTDTTERSREGDSALDDDITLHYSESPGQSASPSPRRPIHPRRSLRADVTLQLPAGRTNSSLAPAGSTNSSLASAYRTRTLSPRPSRNDLESYSIVDLVSIDTDSSARSASVYDSAGSTHSTAFGTPQNTTGRKTRSTIDPTLLGSSTPYVKSTRSSTLGTRSSSDTLRKSPIDRSQSATRSSTGSRRSKSLSTPENTEDIKKHISANSTKISRASRSRSRINDSDLLLVDDDADSPRTSKRISTISKSTRSNTNTVSGNNNTVMSTPVNSPAQNEGTSTPENRHSPEEASTPVLSIQSLLDSSQSSLASQNSTRRGRPSFNTKRKTIAVITGPKVRVSAKSKSMNFSARKTRLRLSDDSVETSTKTTNGSQDEIVTPKSAVKLVQEGVKNKHSTAKKPQSKRSIIDDLNESDIVKQLFNSPVKRKLSQSMTEFSRKQLFDDDEVVQSKRPMRNTVALTDRTLENSPLDNTAYTPEMFVSPISTPTNSPNLTGIKRMFAKNTPENDLRNVRGVKGLLRTPRVKRSINNDLTNVSGVKAIFAKSPKNRLSDVRVKEVFASSPKNDLRRVSGVKSLFQSGKKRKSPRNELDDVRGVKKLFKANSPVNDLRNVSGVKRTLRKHSPKNDLSDVRGVRLMFRQEKQRNDLNDVSGVEELFNESNQSHRDAESLFDQLIGKPPIKAVYSKTFCAKTVHKKRGSKSKSLHASLDIITNNVEDWLQKEINKRLHTNNEITLKSVNKANVTRELQKLMTDTVEGSAPIRTSRARSSTVGRSSEAGRKKSASELYGAHTLPIKKRSLVEASLEKGKEDSRSNILPIKKRVVVHSTPVKGRVNVTMNASVLGRVSPIAAIDETQDVEQNISIRSNDQSKEANVSRSKSRRGTKANIDLETIKAPDFVKLSPRKSRGQAKVVSTKAKPASPNNVSSHAKTKKTSPTKPKTASLVKSQVASPVKTQEISPAKPKKASPVKAKVASPAKSNKTSLAKSQKASPVKDKVVTPIKSKKISPAKPKKAIPAKDKVADPATKFSPVKSKLASPVQVKSTRSRRKDVSIPETNTKKLRATLVVAKKSPVISPKPRASRKRKELDKSPPSTKLSPKKTPVTRNHDDVTVDKPKTPKNTRSKVQKATVVISKPSPQLKTRATRNKVQIDSEPEKTGKTRKTVIIHDKSESPKKSQAKKQTKVTEVQAVLKTRGRKTVAEESNDNTEVEKPEAKQKGRRTEESAKPVRNTRNTRQEKKKDQASPKNTRKTEQAKSIAEPAHKKTRKTEIQEKVIEEPKTRVRGKKIESQESVQSEPSTRGRRAAKPVTPEIKTRKRKTTAPDNDIPVKLSKSNNVIETAKAKSARGGKKLTVKETNAEKAQGDGSVKTTRGRKAAEVDSVKSPNQIEPKAVRGKKANAENIPTNQKTGKRKREAVELPAEDRSKKPVRGKQSAVVTSPAAQKSTRATRGKVQKEANKPAGRSRRR